MLAPEGHGLILGAAGLALGTVVLGGVAGGWAWTVSAAGIVGLGVTAWFFRDPERTPPADTSDLLVAPADGTVVEIVSETEPHYLGGPSRRVSIFLSPLNVHVNRIPADGVVEYERYVPGAFVPAWRPKASEANERSEVGVRHPSGARVLFKQIAGLVARRIVYDAPIGGDVRAGERYGIIRFGSRMDVAVPPHVALSVQVGQKTVAGETILGTFGTVPQAVTRRPERVEAA